ncbi:flagellar hook-length control protein FliK [Marinilactibacillus piezotolerans]|uniref:flagellar hook-length control protein FliK n=1 Tax=Marinilactibacillus piezotolerans TaxID=258723 RepID=UPI0009AFB67B|nr:flagellar hook-length control protein FliK [Marinilactibacillus piezotolerans]
MTQQVQLQSIKSAGQQAKSKETKSDNPLFVSYLSKQTESGKSKESETASSQPKDSKSVSETGDSFIKKEKTSEEAEEQVLMVSEFLQFLLKNEETVSTLNQPEQTLIANITKQASPEVVLNEQKAELVARIVDQLNSSQKTKDTTSTPVQLKDLVPKEQIADPTVYKKQVFEQKHETTLVESIEQALKEISSKEESSRNVKGQSLPANASNENAPIKQPSQSFSLSKENQTMIHYLKHLSTLTESAELILTEKTGGEGSIEMNSQQSIQDTLNLVSASETSATTSETVSTEGTEQTIISKFSTETALPETKSNQTQVQQSIQLTQQPVTESVQLKSSEVPAVMTKADLAELQSMVTEKIQQPGKPELIKSTVQLTPETLGKVTIELEYSDSKLFGKLTVISEEAKRLVEQQFKSVTFGLGSQSIPLEKIEITVLPPQESFEAAFNFSEQQHAQHSFEEQAQQNNILSHAESEEESERSRTETNNQAGSLNLMA